MKKKIYSLFIIISMMFLLISCDDSPYIKGYSFHSMGAVIEVQLYEKTDEDMVFDAVFDIFSFYGQLTSNYKRNEVEETSPYYDLNNIYLINEKAGVEAVKVKEELIDVLEFSIELNEQTNGYFNVGLGKVSKIWKDAIDKNLVLSYTEYLKILDIITDLETPDLSKVIIDKVNQTVYLEDESFSLDLGGIAKGYATQLAYNYLKDELGLKRFKINSGASSIGIGLPPVNHPIKTYIRDDNSTSDNNFYKDGLLGYIPGGNKHIATSGSGQQYVNVFDDFGFYKKIHHLISPFTLMPINHYYKVTLIGDNSSLLDAYATAVYLMPLDEAEMFLTEHNIGYVLYLMDYSLKTNLSEADFVQYEIVGEIN